MTDAVESEYLAHFDRLAAGAGRSVAIVEVHGGFADYRGVQPFEGPADDEEMVAVDIELDVPAGAFFDFNEIVALVNGAEIRSVFPQRLALDGVPIRWGEGTFATSPGRYRVLCAFIVRRGTRELALGYFGRTLTDAPIALDDTGAPPMLQD